MKYRDRLIEWLSKHTKPVWDIEEKVNNAMWSARGYSNGLVMVGRRALDDTEHFDWCEIYAPVNSSNQIDEAMAALEQWREDDLAKRGVS